MRLGRRVLTITVALVSVGCATSTDGGAPDGSSHARTTPAAGSTASPGSAAVTVVELPEGDDATVDHAVDGDTIVLRGGERVRLIGIDTPETKDPRRGVQCFGKEASRRTTTLLPRGERVRLAYDAERQDRYGRTLAYVYRARDRLFVNAAIVRDGFASAYTYPPNVAHADELVALEREARGANRGLWGACEGEGDSPATSTNSPSAGGDSAGAGSGCDPAYPGVCIPSPPPDLDCGDVDDRRFRVLPPDPHRFDADGNGVGCEGA